MKIYLQNILLFLQLWAFGHFWAHVVHANASKFYSFKFFHSDLGSSRAGGWDLTLAELHDLVLRSFLKFNKARTKFNEVITKS